MSHSTSSLSRSKRVLFLFVVCPLALSGCTQLLCDFGVSDLCEATYTVTYAPNGADEGSVPFDFSEYQEQDMVTVLPNSGGLDRSGYSFDGWNTAANGAGISYSVGAIFAMGSANVALYAEWLEDEDSDDDEDDSDIRPDAILEDIYEPDGAYQATELIPDGRIQNHTFHPTGTLFPVTTPEGTKYKGDEDNYYVDVDLDVVGETATLEIRTYGDTDTFLSAYAPDGGDGIAYGQEWICATVETSGRYMVLARHLDEYEGTGEYLISALLGSSGCTSSDPSSTPGHQEFITSFLVVS